MCNMAAAGGPAGTIKLHQDASAGHGKKHTIVIRRQSQIQQLLGVADAAAAADNTEDTAMNMQLQQEP